MSFEVFNEVNVMKVKLPDGKIYQFDLFSFH